MGVPEIDVKLSGAMVLSPNKRLESRKCLCQIRMSKKGKLNIRLSRIDIYVDIVFPYTDRLNCNSDRAISTENSRPKRASAYGP